MGWLCGCQGGEFRHGNLWLNIACGGCFGGKVSMGLGGFQGIVDGINEVFVI